MALCERCKKKDTCKTFMTAEVKIEENGDTLLLFGCSYFEEEDENNKE